VDFDENYDHAGMTKFMSETNIHFSEYSTVAVIGCQSTGKSTMMNLLFDTDFHTLDATKGRNQTTQGIWLAKDAGSPILVMDLEGTDSQTRGADGAAFEHKASLFALAISNVLIVNLWTHEIGRYKAASVGLLKTIFEVNMKLFSDQPRQKILFVLRDFNDENDKLIILK
jgi:GTPase Era involved in 16S rRNA processing